MGKIELTKEKLSEILAESHDEQVMEKYYELALKDEFVASSHGHIVAFLLMLTRYKFEKLFVKNNITVEYFLGLNNFNENNEYWKFGDLLERTNFEIAFWLVEDDNVDDKTLVEFSEMHAYYLFCIGDYFNSIRICGNALFRDPNNTLCNFIKASLIDLCYINKTPIKYKIALVNYQKNLIDKCDPTKIFFDKSIYYTVYDEIDKKYKQIPEEGKCSVFIKVKKDYQETVKQIPEWTQEHDFCLRKVLLLNPLNYFGHFVEAFIEDFDSLPINEEYKRYFNEIVNDYELCRGIAFSYYNEINNVGKREMSMVYSYAYSIFDKVAFLIKNVYDLDVNEDRVYFNKKCLFDKKIKGTNIKFKNLKNSNIVPLYRIMKKVREKYEFVDALNIGTFKHYELRNTIEHKSIDLVDEDILKRNVDFLLRSVKDLILYTFMLLHSHSPNQELDKLTFTGTTYVKALKILTDNDTK